MFRFVLRFKYPVLAIAAVSTLLLALELPPRFDPDTEAYVPKGHPMRMFWEEARDRFGVGREIMVAVEAAPPHGVFTPEILAGIRRLADAIKDIPIVVESDVRSIDDADAIVGTEDGLDVVPFFEDPPDTLEEARAVRDRVFDNPVYLNRLVSEDGTIASIIVPAADSWGVDAVDVYAAVQAVVDSVEIPGARLLVAGNPAIEAVYGEQMSTDLGQLLPLSLVAVVWILFLCFRELSVGRLLARAAVIGALLAAWLALSTDAGGAAAWVALAPVAVTLAMLTVRSVALPAVVVIASVVWTWGIQAIVDVPVYIAGTLVPPLLLAIGCAYGIHILERYYDKAAEFGGSGGDDAPGTATSAVLASTATMTRDDVVLATMDELWRPVVLTSLTTAAGFGSLMAGSMTVYQVFGLTTAIGILVAMTISLTVLPAALSTLPLPERSSHRGEDGVVPRLLMRLGRSIERRPVATAVSGVVVTVFFLACSAWLRVDFSWIETLQPGTPVLEADRILRTRHGGTMPLGIIVRTGEADGVKRPEVLRAMDALLAELAEDPVVGDTRSIAEYIKRMSQAMNEDREEAFVIPDSRELVAQYLLLYSMSGDPGELDDMVDYEYEAAHLGVLLRSDRMAVLDQVVDRTEALIAKHFAPLGLTATATSSAVIQRTIFRMILESQLWSLATACTLVLLFMAVIFRSVRDAFICMIPPLFTGVVCFGGMGLLGVPLGPDKAMISAIALGIGIDYSIHLMSRFRDVVKAGMSVDDGVVEAMRTTGRAVLFNGAVVVAGFSVLAFSTAPSNAAFGLTIAANMAISCVAALILMPAALTILGHVLLERARRAPVTIGGVEFGARLARDLGMGDDVSSVGLDGRSR